MLWGSQAKARSVNSNHKSRVLLSSGEGFLSKGDTRGKSREAGETVYHKGHWRSHIRNLTLSCHSVDCYLGHSLEGGASVSSRPCWPLSHTKWMPRQQYYGGV